ncbi:unnamed protein product [Plutella xylostella]|uniref:Reticulocalbin-3 n=1 Tax=Plutella xylostella TaxID=51655 RepID=A0A8S4F251_PLUXY|nr:unnamed protein product [Plutella xylostella]
MASYYVLSFIVLITHNMVMNCASAAVHGHSVDADERAADGAYRPRDAGHYSDGVHHSEFDHEAILGSVKEAEEYDRLSPEEAKQRFSQLLLRMDLNGDQFIDRSELKQWFLKTFRNLSREEADERFSESDADSDGQVTWREYLQDSFGIDGEEDLHGEEEGETGVLVKEEREMWYKADKDGDNILDKTEFEVFINPEEHAEMHALLVRRQLREKDGNGDGVVDFNEYVGQRGNQQDKEWYISEQHKFKHELDANDDGVLDENEVKGWIIPNNEELAEEELEHMFELADDDRDDRLSFEEMLRHHRVFVGSADDRDDHDDRFDDEL